MLKKLLSVPLRYKPWRPLHLRLIAADLGGGVKQASRDNETHLAAAIGWLCRAQDIRANSPDAGGVSAGWSYEDGWLPSYPETSGYIVETFLAASGVLGRPELVDRAGRILDWELSTIGHPFADLAAVIMQWQLPAGSEGRGMGGLDRAALGLPSDEEFIAEYCARRGLSGIDNFGYYLGFTFFRMAAIIQGVLKRALDGNASNPERAMKVGAFVPVFAQHGLDALKRG